jgi:hypothetical protein
MPKASLAHPDTAGQALAIFIAEGARQHRQHGPIYGNWLHIAERSDPELARRIKALHRAQQELDDYVLSITETEGNNSHGSSHQS